ncbi:hypothetical protein [Allorhizocola rhizosphaerae]|uniref:hypothetical protein n=1 Tax=Allorhizocola rhizosphaerae TaxID=1872709 RepID=UPI000E3D8455|nr:hypothetical protein [Allorhizocola rhizosphaerae]
MLYRRRYVWVTVAACVAVVLAGLAAWKLTRDTPDGSARALADRLAARSWSSVAKTSAAWMWCGLCFRAIR